MPGARLMFENDSRHTLIYMYEPPIQREEYEAAVDELLGTPVEAVVFNLGYGNAFLHATSVAERWGPQVQATEAFRPHGDEQWDHLVFQRAYRNAKQLIESGNDPLRLVCERAQAKNLQIYPSLQVQADLGPKVSIGKQHGLDANDPRAHLADFALEVVRQQRFNLIEETANYYPIDGFELNLNHYAGGCFFGPTGVETGRHVFTEWITRIYDVVKQSGPKRELALRIPASIEGCWSLGLDPEEWVRQGIVDVLVAETFSAMSLIDATADFRALVRAVRNSSCRVHAVVRNNVDSDRLGTAPIEMIRAAVTNYWSQGIDGLNLVHWAASWPYGPCFYEQLRELPHPEVMATRDKIYTIPTPPGRHHDVAKIEPGLAMQLPANLTPNQTRELVLPISDDLDRWAEASRVYEVILRLRLMRATERDKVSFRLNGAELPTNLLRRIDHVYQMNAPRFRSHSSYWYVFRLDRDHWPVQGQNRIDVTLQYRDPEVTPEIYVRDVELEIRYLRGKSAHRGPYNTDSDLGPYAHEVT